MPLCDFAHIAQVFDVAVIPNTRRRKGILVRFRVDGTELREYHAPAALGLHAAQMCLSARPLRTRAGAVGGLPKAIASFLRSYLDRLEQHIMFRVASHVFPPPDYTVGPGCE